MFHRLSLIFLLLSSADGFINNARTRNSQVFLHGSASSGEDFSAGGGDDPVEAARRRFEAMMVGVGDTSAIPSPTNAEVTAGPSSSSVAERPTLDVSNFPPLTSTAKQRRLAEIDFLSSLNDSDEGREELWNLWGSERGPAAARLLKQADECILERRRWGKAEMQLRKLIYDYGMYWTEPASRLAALLFMQGRLEESKEMCLKVLAVKPWHFDALSGVVVCYAGLNEVSEARYWAARRLPPLQPTGPNRRRQQWVIQASKEARNMLKQLEDQTRASYGPSEHPGDLPQPPPRPPFLEDDEEDAWQ